MTMMADCSHCSKDSAGNHHSDCPLAPKPGIYDVMALNFAWNCSAGAHEWLPWARLDSGVMVTRCVHCQREERIDP